SKHRAGLHEVVIRSGDVQAIAAMDASSYVGDGDYPAAELSDEPGGPGPDVAEPLDGHSGALQVRSEVLRRFGQAVHDSAPGRGISTVRATELDRLARDDGGRVAVAARVGVHHPCHRASVGIDVRRRD